MNDFACNKSRWCHFLKKTNRRNKETGVSNFTYSENKLQNREM